jgi:Ca2+-binding EF-hand superfamily protein
MYEGQPVEADAPVLLKHVSSSNYLGCSSKIEDGKKFALVCKNFTAAKTRSCVTYTAENEFTIVTAKKIADSIDDRVFVDMTAGAILGKIQSRVKSRGSCGMRGLGRVFRSMDDAGDGVLDREDFLFGLGDYLGSSMADDELALVVDLFDSNGDGLISLTEFIAKIRGPLSARRKDMIMQAYAILDKDGSGVVNVMDLKDAFDVKAHPEVVSGNKTAEAVLKEFLVQWDKTGDGAVTRGEFLEYYADVSASIDSDDYFELMMRNAWHISGGEGALANTTNRRVLVVYEDGTQTVEEITNDLGIGPKDKDAMIANLTAQGIKGIADVQLSG